MNKSYQNFKKRVGKLAVTFALVGTTAAGGMAVATDSVDAATVKSGYTSTTVTLRKSASTKSAKLTTIKKGAKVTILKTSGKWLKVKYNGKTGYVYKTYVKKTFTTKDYSGKFKLKTDLTVRKGPGTSFVKAGTLKKGTVVTVKGKTSNGWYTITYKGSTRYISASSKYLTKYVAPTPTPKPDPTPTPKPDPTPTPKPEVNQGPTLNVNSKYYVTTGDTFTYSDLGATAYDKEDGDITYKIEYKCITSPEGVNPSNGVNPNKAGNYKVQVTVTDSKGASASEIVYVVVGRNEPPKLSVDTKDKRISKGTGDLDYIFTVVKGSNYSNSLLPITASDLEDGDITYKIEFSGLVDTSNTHKGIPYQVKVKVVDSKGIPAMKTIGVKVVENNNPTIKAADDIYVFEGSDFGVSVLKSKAKVSAYDVDEVTSDGYNYKDLTGNIEYYYMSKVNTSKPGTYTVGLSLKDVNGGSTYKKVKVHVVENKKPVINCVDKFTVEGNKFTYNSLGATAYDEAQYGVDSKDVLTPYKDLTSAIQYSGNVDINTPGTYKLTLTVSDGMKTTTKEVSVIVEGNREAVIDSRDSIELSVGEFDENVTYEQIRDRFIRLANLSVFDYEDGYLDVTDESKVELVGLKDITTNHTGTYTVQVKAKDSNRVIATKNIVVYVVEKQPANDSIYNQ